MCCCSMATSVHRVPCHKMKAGSRWKVRACVASFNHAQAPGWGEIPAMRMHVRLVWRRPTPNHPPCATSDQLVHACGYEQRPKTSGVWDHKARNSPPRTHRTESGKRQQSTESARVIMGAQRHDHAADAPRTCKVHRGLNLIGEDGPSRVFRLTSAAGLRLCGDTMAPKACQGDSSQGCSRHLAAWMTAQIERQKCLMRSLSWRGIRCW
jgi:hypothetical protein